MSARAKNGKKSKTSGKPNEGTRKMREMAHVGYLRHQATEAAKAGERDADGSVLPGTPPDWMLDRSLLPMRPPGGRP